MTIPNGRASFTGFTAGATYLVRLSGSVAYAGTPLTLVRAPGAFTINSLSNDALLSSFPVSKLEVPGTPGAYQFALQLDPGGNGLRYGFAPPLGSSQACASLPWQSTLPGRSLDIVASPPQWAGSIKASIFGYAGSGTPTAGHRYTTTATGSGAFYPRESSKYLFTSQGADYRAKSVQIKLTAQVTETLGGKSKAPKLVSGSATVQLLLGKVKGTGAARVTQPLRYRLTAVQDLDTTPTGQAFDFQGTLTSAGPGVCSKLDVYTDPSGLLDFHVCQMEGEGQARTTITPGH